MFERDAIYCLLADLPLEIEWRGAQWRVFVTEEFGCFHCYVQENGKAESWYISTGATLANLHHGLRKIGIATPRSSVPGLLFQHLAGAGSAEQLPRKRTLEEFPLPDADARFG